jgi:hypothetical protein
MSHCAGACPASLPAASQLPVRISGNSITVAGITHSTRIVPSKNPSENTAAQ